MQTKRTHALPFLLPLACMLLASCDASSTFSPSPPPASSPIVLEEFIATRPPTPQSHASTLVETRDGTLLAAWFGGEHEGAADVGIWLTRREGEGWQSPRRVAGGVQDDAVQDGVMHGDVVQDDAMRVENSPQPTWNPVLFQPAHGPVQLYYKAGPNPRQWWGMLTVSNDDGLHWSAPRRLPDGILGPIKNKPLQLPNGRILAPSSSEDEADGWRVHIETSDDNGLHWQRGAALNDPAHIGAIQPSLLRHRDGRLQALGRSKQDRVFSTFSSDDGETWGPMTLLDIENPNAGTDAVMLHDGRALLVYNPALAGEDWWDGRGVLAVALSDDGVHWQRVLTLEDSAKDEFSYPAVIQTCDGLVHISYTWKRQRIKHVVLDPRLLPSQLPEAKASSLPLREGMSLSSPSGTMTSFLLPSGGRASFLRPPGEGPAPAKARVARSDG